MLQSQQQRNHHHQQTIFESMYKSGDICAKCVFYFCQTASYSMHIHSMYFFFVGFVHLVNIGEKGALKNSTRNTFCNNSSHKNGKRVKESQRYYMVAHFFLLRNVIFFHVVGNFRHRIFYGSFILTSSKITSHKSSFEV